MSIRRSLREFFERNRISPIEADDTAYSAQAMALSFALVSALWLASSTFFQADVSRYQPLFLGITVVLLGIAGLGRMGWGRTAAWLLVGYVFIISWVGVLLDGGSAAPSVGAFIIAALAGIVLLGPRGAASVVSLCIASLVTILLAETSGLLPGADAVAPDRIISTQLALIGAGTGIAWVGLSRLRKSRRLLQRIADAFPAAVYIYDLDRGEVVFRNAEVRRQLGFEEVLAEHPGLFLKAIHPEDRKRVVEHLGEMGELPDGELSDLLYRARNVHDQQLWLRDRAQVFQRERDGRVRQMLGVCEDVTQGVEAQQARHASEERFRALAERAPDLIAEIDSKGVVRYANPAFARLGYAPEEVVGRSVMDLIDPQEREKASSLWEALEAGSARVTWRILARDGSRRWYESQLSRFTDPAGETRFISSGRDVTEQLALLDRLGRVDRMESLGQLAGGIAHDFNNYLTVILASTEELLRGEDVPPALRRAAADARSAAEQSSNLTRQLLAFSRRKLLQPRIVSLNEVVREAERMLQRLLPENIEIDVVLDPKLASVRADPSQLQQLVVNLATNARDAMPEGGRLVLETRNVSADEDESPDGTTPALRGAYTMLSVTDTGTGIDEVVRSRIFEPLFSTKSPGEGTGLGLATVDAIVRVSAGVLRVESELGEGTVFRVFLPSVEEEAEAAAAAQPARRSEHGSVRVLLVEDHDAVRRAVRQILVEAGHRVSEAHDGREALALFEATPDAFDLLLTDVMLPELGGIELAERIEDIAPKARVLLMSGYAADGSGAEGLDGKYPVVEKPFTSAKLLEELSAAL